MNKETEFDKLRMLFGAVKSLDKQEPEREDSNSDEYFCEDFNAELKEAAWNVLHENPGYGFDEWRQTLIEEYPTEVVDALGSDPFEASASLADMWDSWDYEDVETGECHTFQEWAEYFATEKSVELYDLLVDAKREISHLDSRSSRE